MTKAEMEKNTTRKTSEIIDELQLSWGIYIIYQCVWSSLSFIYYPSPHMNIFSSCCLNHISSFFFSFLSYEESSEPFNLLDSIIRCTHSSTQLNSATKPFCCVSWMFLRRRLCTLPNYTFPFNKLEFTIHVIINISILYPKIPLYSIS